MEEAIAGEVFPAPAVIDAPPLCRPPPPRPPPSSFAGSLLPAPPRPPLSPSPAHRKHPAHPPCPSTAAQLPGAVHYSCFSSPPRLQPHNCSPLRTQAAPALPPAGKQKQLHTPVQPSLRRPTNPRSQPNANFLLLLLLLFLSSSFLTSSSSSGFNPSVQPSHPPPLRAEYNLQNLHAISIGPTSIHPRATATTSRKTQVCRSRCERKTKKKYCTNPLVSYRGTSPSVTAAGSRHRNSIHRYPPHLHPTITPAHPPSRLLHRILPLCR